MVYGTNWYACLKCGEFIKCTDSIDIICPECTKKSVEKVTDLSNSVEIDDREILKECIHDIIRKALSGTDDKYRYVEKEGYNSFIRWGVVGKEIDSLIDKLWPKETKK